MIHNIHNFVTLFSRQPELNLLDHESIQTGDEGWLVFDVTAASNHWLLNAKYNAGLRLYVENDEGETQPHQWLFGL